MKIALSILLIGLTYAQAQASSAPDYTFIPLNDYQVCPGAPAVSVPDELQGTWGLVGATGAQLPILKIGPQGAQGLIALYQHEYPADKYCIENYWNWDERKQPDFFSVRFRTHNTFARIGDAKISKERTMDFVLKYNSVKDGFEFSGQSTGYWFPSFWTWESDERVPAFEVVHFTHKPKQCKPGSEPNQQGSLESGGSGHEPGQNPGQNPCPQEPKPKPKPKPEPGQKPDPEKP